MWCGLNRAVMSVSMRQIDSRVATLRRDDCPDCWKGRCWEEETTDTEVKVVGLPGRGDENVYRPGGEKARGLFQGLQITA